MDKNASSHSILDTLRTIEFRLGLKGYNVDEVDDYLEKAAVEAEQVQERLRTANERLRQATERIGHLEGELQRAPSDRAPVPHAAPATAAAAAPVAERPVTAAVSDDTLQRTLLLAQKFVEQTKRESEAEAAQVVGRAEERARTLLAQAEERAGRTIAEAEERLRDEVARLEDARTHLEGELEATNRQLEEQRTRLRASLTEALRWVDERMQVPPARDAGSSEAPAGPAGPAGHPQGLSPAEESASVPPAAAPGERAGTPAAPAQGTAPRPQPLSAGPERQPAAQPAQTAPPVTERPQAPVGARLGVLNGGLFEARRDSAQGFEENRLGE